MNDQVVIQWEGGTLTIRRATMRAVITRNMLLFRLFEGNNAPIDNYTAYLFSHAMTQTTIEGWDGFVIPGPNADAAQVQRAFAEWLDLPGTLGQQWIDAVQAIDAPQVEPELAPEGKAAAKKAKAD